MCDLFSNPRIVHQREDYLRILMILWIVLGLLTTISGHECPNRSLIEKSLLEVHIPGAVMIVVNTTDILYQEAFGHQSFLPTQRMDADRSIFLLASISKTFIAVAAMQLVESGRVQLDADVNQYLLPTDPRIVHPSHPSSAITLRQLLSHSASIGSNEQVEPYFFFPDDDGLVKTTLADACFSYLTGSEANWLPYAPGTVTLYSNVGTGLAGLIVERVTGVSFERYVRANILKPLEIETAFRLSDVKERVDLVRHYSYGSSNYDRWKSLMPRLNVTQVIHLFRFLVNKHEIVSVEYLQLAGNSTLQPQHVSSRTAAHVRHFPLEIPAHVHEQWLVTHSS